jgi:hypothetical protein
MRKMAKVEGTAYVRFDFEVQVTLPEGIEFECEEDDHLAEKSKNRAIEAAIASFPDSIKIYIDGEKEPPTNVYFDVSDYDITEVRGEAD